MNDTDQYFPKLKRVLQNLRVYLSVANVGSFMRGLKEGR